MKYLFISTKYKKDFNISSDFLKNLPKNIIIAYSIQFEEIAKKIKEKLSSKYNIVDFIQTLGCSKPKISKKVQAILLISNGKFHATSLAYETKLPVYLLDNQHFVKVSSEDIEKLQKNEKIAYMKYLNATDVGILISTKPGQQRLNQVLEFTKKNMEKKYYYFLANNLDTSEFENFQIKSWINTACPRMDLVDNSIINISKLLQ